MEERLITKNGIPLEDTDTYKWGSRIAELMLYTHIALMILFFVVQASIVSVVNIFSITIYAFERRVIKKNPVLFLDIFVIEVLVHMLLAVYFTGWDMGFQYYAFAMGSVVFFSDHAIKRDGFNTVHPVFFGILTMVSFFICRILYLYTEPYYSVKPSIASTVHTINGLAILLILWLFSYIYINSILQREKQLVKNAQYDELTGLPNRHQLDEVLKERRVGELDGDKEYAVAIFDLDDFKKVNDRFGHLAGDQVLKNIAAILKRQENDDVFVGRWGGEEFVALVKGENAYKRTMELAENIRLQVENSIVFFEHWQLRITVSVGVTGTKKGKNFNTLVEEADTYLYESKGNGKNQVTGKWGMV